MSITPEWKSLTHVGANWEVELDIRSEKGEMRHRPVRFTGDRNEEWRRGPPPDGPLSESAGVPAIWSNKPAWISFVANGEVVFALKPDGTIEKGPAYRSDDQASVAFLDCLARFAPNFIADLRNRIVELEQENERLKANCST